MRGRAVHCGLPCFLLFTLCVCPAENVFYDETDGSYFVKIFRIFLYRVFLNAYLELYNFLTCSII